MLKKELERECVLQELSCGERMGGNGEEALRKGPWKAEEDEVLLNHVRRYGSRDWSSIRSKGLLRRTGKSCRLRWVNKLRPNLKNGCKFSAEEERVVIELQAQFGNKWAKIATYLAGRTDNDVKNFWSSRQKRLARALQNSATSSKSHKQKKELSTFHEVCTYEGPKLSASSEGKSSSKALLSSDNHFLSSLTDCVQTELNHVETKPYLDCLSHFPFPQIPQPQQDLPCKSGSQDLMAWLDDSYSDVLGFIDSSELGNDLQLPIGQPVSAPDMDRGYHITPRGQIDNSMTPDWFFDDFPANIFDQMEPLSSPSEL